MTPVESAQATDNSDSSSYIAETLWKPGPHLEGTRSAAMDMRAYQEQALETDQIPLRDHGNASAALVVPLLGLAGEAGELLSEYKKHLRDGEAHRLFKERVAEELGDLLWYIADVASKFDLDLADIAEGNLRKVRARWQDRRESVTPTFDARFPEAERLPRRIDVELSEVMVEGRLKMRALANGRPIGDPLTDNAYDHDGYRFHDVFHLAYAAVLGWSPVTRANLRCKRKSDPIVDEVEDGGRAAAIEEGLSAVVFDYARDHKFLDGVAVLDYGILRTVKSVTSHLEVSACTVGDWERAILQGYEVWREVVKNRGGHIVVDLNARSISYLRPSKSGDAMDHAQTSRAAADEHAGRA